VRTKTMRDFIGMETVNDEGRDALLNFSFYLTIGNMDEAYKVCARCLPGETVA
jgi:intraflagellar transport protein 140